MHACAPRPLNTVYKNPFDGVDVQGKIRTDTSLFILLSN